jgi:LAO/AO transport system kinase
MVTRIRDGDRRSLARALTIVENQLDGFEQLIDIAYPDVGRAWRIGLTGPPGAGKSTVASRLIELLLSAGETVGYLAVDPTSPFSGGAVLGDRVRVETEAGENLFIRSAASRGSLGGLSRQSEALADVLDVAGFSVIIVESVGVGQVEVDIAHSVDTVVVLLVPESGDEIQVMKAGLLEIADILCVNKSDRASADELVAALEQSIMMRDDVTNRAPKVVRSVATEPGGVEDLFDSLRSHRSELVETGLDKTLRDERLRRRVEAIARFNWESKFWTSSRRQVLASALASVNVETRRPYSLASLVIAAGDSA